MGLALCLSLSGCITFGNGAKPDGAEVGGAPIGVVVGQDGTPVIWSDALGCQPRRALDGEIVKFLVGKSIDGGLALNFNRRQRPKS